MSDTAGTRIGAAAKHRRKETRHHRARAGKSPLGNSHIARRRAHAAMETLHPQGSSYGHTWRRDLNAIPDPRNAREAPH